MAQFTAYDPKVEVLGIAMLATTAGMGEKAKSILAKHGLGDIQPDNWYLMQSWLDFFREVTGEGTGDAMFDLVSIGMKIPENALFPPEIDSVVSALHSIEVAYHMNHRNGEIGHYHAKVVGENAVDMLCENPYPCDFDYGLIFGTARRFRPAGTAITVEHDPAGCRKTGASACTYHVTWG